MVQIARLLVNAAWSRRDGPHIFVPHVGVCAQQAVYLFLAGGLFSRLN